MSILHLTLFLIFILHANGENFNYASFPASENGTCYKRIPHTPEIATKIAEGTLKIVPGSLQHETSGYKTSYQRSWVTILDCCDGFLRNSETNECEAHCDEGCVGGTCMGANNCVCEEGWQAVRGVCSPVCRKGCPRDAYCFSPDVCTCKQFFEEINGICRPICPDGCAFGDCVGPKECRCHPGYVLNGRNQCEPYCDSGCPHGDCVSPGICSCYEGYKNPRGLRGSCIADCPEGCDDGECISPGVCACPAGFERITKGLCKPFCSFGCDHGTCVAPEQCECNQGFVFNPRSKKCIVCLPGNTCPTSASANSTFRNTNYIPGRGLVNDDDVLPVINPIGDTSEPLDTETYHQNNRTGGQVDVYKYSRPDAQQNNYNYQSSRPDNDYQRNGYYPNSRPDSAYQSNRPSQQTYGNIYTSSRPDDVYSSGGPIGQSHSYNRPSSRPDNDYQRNDDYQTSRPGGYHQSNRPTEQTYGNVYTSPRPDDDYQRNYRPHQTNEYTYYRLRPTESEDSDDSQKLQGSTQSQRPMQHQSAYVPNNQNRPIPESDVNINNNNQWYMAPVSTSAVNQPILTNDHDEERVPIGQVIYPNSNVRATIYVYTPHQLESAIDPTPLLPTPIEREYEVPDFRSHATTYVHGYFRPGNYERSVTDSDGNPPHCELPCHNGECVADNQCACKLGYRPDPYALNDNKCIPICDRGCDNGICAMPNVCICKPGFSIDHETLQCVSYDEE